MTKPTKGHVRQAKTQISLDIRSVWSVFAVRLKKHWTLSYPLSPQRRLWSDWADAKADLSLRWAHVILLVLSWHGSTRLFCSSFSRLTKWLEDVFEPGLEKMCLMSYANNKGADQPAHPRRLISTFIVRCLDSIISLRFYSWNFKTLACFCGSAGQFVSVLVGNSQRHILRVVAHLQRWS